MKNHEQTQVVVIDGALLDTIEETKRKLKLGRTKIYELINGGHLQVVKLGRNTRVVAASTQRLVNDLLRERA
jgi:hypothetical protein